MVLDEGEVPGSVRYFGDYELEEEIGRGGMGVVYRARQQSLDRPVAVKMLLAAELASEKTVQRFQIEAKAAAALGHENIVPIYEIGEHDSQSYFSMKLIEGGRGILDVKQAAPKVIARTMAKVARAVAYAHSHGVLHRDLKPGNVLLDDKGEPLLTDFGLAKMLESSAGDLTKTKVMMGTMEYVAPEVVTGGMRSVTTAVDVYGLGAILFELLTGSPSFEGGDVLNKVLTEAAQISDEAVDPDLKTICLKCLSKRPQDRYDSAAEVADELERFASGEPIKSRPVGQMKRIQLWTIRHPVKAVLVATSAVLLTLVWTHFITYIKELPSWTSKFGTAIDADGDRLIVGEYRNPHSASGGGAAFVYDLDSNEETLVLYPPRPSREGELGFSTAIDGRWAAVGERNHSGTVWHSGAAYVFDLKNGGRARELVPPDLGYGNRFGYSVDVSDGIVAVGAPFNLPRGQVYLFDAETGELLSRPTLEDLGWGKGPGYRVLIDGDRLVIAASYDWSRSGKETLHVFDVSDPRAPVLQYVLSAKDHGSPKLFGFQLAAEGNRLLAGAHDGTVFLFDFETGKLIAELPAGETSESGGMGMGDGFVAVRQGNAGKIALFAAKDGSPVTEIACPEERYNELFGIRIAIAQGKLFAGQKGIKMIGDSHTPVFQFDLASGEYEKSIWSLRRSYFGDTLFFTVFGLCLIIPIALTVWLLRRKERAL